MSSTIEQLVKECKRQSESCLYTSLSLFIWLRFLRKTRIVFVVLNTILGGLAGWTVIEASSDSRLKLIGAVCALLAGVLPAIYATLKVDDGIARCASLAGEFKNLQDRFRQAALIGSTKPCLDFEKSFHRLMVRMERARAHSYTAPEWCFKRAQKKINNGDMSFGVDGELDQTSLRPE